LTPGALGCRFDDKIDGTLSQWIGGLRTDWNTGADADASPRLANRQVAITAGISTSRPLTALADDRELCFPQPDSNLTETCHSGFSPIGGHSAGWLHFSLAF